MTLLLIITDFVGLITVCVLAVLLMRERANRKERNLVGAWPIQPVLPEAIDPAFRPGAFGPGRETEVRFVGRGPYAVDGGTTDAEAWILAALAKQARRMFEFGTCTGKTAYLWARNSPEDARVTTITLAPEHRSGYQKAASDNDRDIEFALAESAYTAFLYTGTSVEHKIEQLFGDSKTLDITPWEGTCDLVFVDGSHAYSYVVSDSQRALGLVRPGGLVLWHDYAGPRHSPGVYRALNELAVRLPLVRIKGTALVVFRRPGDLPIARG
jgi:predicted O-methyltransferase YrrM